MNKKRFDEIIDQLTARKSQLLAAGVMLMLSAGPIAAAHFYVPERTAAADYALLETLPVSIRQEETTIAVPETAVTEEAYIPTPGELNLAHYFPEGADTGKITESLAGRAFKELMTHDEDWMSSIYDMADASPLQMANALGKSRDSVLGKYNNKDELHDMSNPDSWTINSFKKVRMSFTNGDGQPVSAYSNVIDIMSMANLFTYFGGVENYDLFLSYSKALWEKSHSYTAGISSIYYCDGCLNEDAERREYEALEAEARAEEEAGYAYPPETEPGLAEQTEHAAAESTSAVIIAGTTKNPPPETVEATTAAPQETVLESTSGVIVAGQAADQERSGTLSEEETSPPAAAAEAADPSQAAAAEAADPSQAAAAQIPESSAGETEDTQATPANARLPELKITESCPGHVDLIVNVKVAGMKEENGLFKLDSIGNNSATIEEGGWPGWNSYTRASARSLSRQDWFLKYGLSLSVIAMRNPLTEAEIDSYMNQLPVGLSQTRKDLIHFALSSVGKVPYYWGGKPSSPNYSGNSFGILTAPDYKGRVLKGLDCSGWINWVYWSVTGQRLSYESTSGLAISGSKVSRSELQPGDIIVRTGTDAHVIMFLGWTADGKIRCIHESSAGVNNVTVAIRDANWPYYRKLVD